MSSPVLSPRPFVAACVQMTSGRDMDANLETVSRLVRQATAEGAEMVFLPENMALMERNRAALKAAAFRENDHPALETLRALARDTGAWLHGGSIAVRPENGEDEADRLLNRSLVIDPTGAVRARYDKLHLFDVSLPGGETYRESATFAPGDTAVTVATPFGVLGLSICYDLRFPQLYRRMAQAGADLLAIPAAFTRTTGKAHWECLVTARAIENGAFVFAPAQGGTHADGRETFGHALIVSPWGAVLARGGNEEAVLCAEIDPAEVHRARARIPSLRHDRPFTLIRA